MRSIWLTDQSPSAGSYLVSLSVPDGFCPTVSSSSERACNYPGWHFCQKEVRVFTLSCAFGVIWKEEAIGLIIGKSDVLNLCVRSCWKSWMILKLEWEFNSGRGEDNKESLQMEVGKISRQNCSLLACFLQLLFNTWLACASYMIFFF